MKGSQISSVHKKFKLLLLCIRVFALTLLPWFASAHPMPNSIVLLDVKLKGVAMELQLPLNELDIVFGHHVNENTATLVTRLGSKLSAYIIQHVKPVSNNGQPWTVEITNLKVEAVPESLNGPYHKLIANLWLQPSANANVRLFTLKYDVIIHQLITHSALVSVRQDWEAGVDAKHPVELGVIALDIHNNTIPPLQVNLGSGNAWTGFKSMVQLGIKHIAEGTDHLMFLLVLLLPAPLLFNKRRWTAFGGVHYSVIRLLKIVTAFTIGHSITLMAGALGWFRLQSQLVEVLIAVSILVSAIHALRPVFPGKEMYVAAGFGLVHGLAFASTLANLNLDAGPMALSILGFNVGIELMQLFIVVITIPWLILLSRTKSYSIVRLTGASFAAIAAIAWIAERLSAKANPFTVLVQRVAEYTPYIVVLLALAAIASFKLEQRNNC